MGGTDSRSSRIDGSERKSHHASFAIWFLPRIGSQSCPQPILRRTSRQRRTVRYKPTRSKVLGYMNPDRRGSEKNFSGACHFSTAVPHVPCEHTRA